MNDRRGINSAPNGTRTTKHHRRTKEEIAAIGAAIYEVLKKDHPQSVRHVFYQLVSPPYSLVPKDQTRGYRPIQRKMLDMRRAGELPWDWVSDGTRWRRQRLTFISAAEAVRHVAETYRRDLWRRTPVYCEVWCESDSMAGVIVGETDRYGVSLMTSRGFSSDSYLYAGANDIMEEGRPAYLYYVGDWDPSGKIIPEVIERRLRAFASGCEIDFNRLLVTPQQIEDWALPTKPAKNTTHAKNFDGGTVEAEAIPARVTRQLVRDAIEQHLDLREVEVIKTAETSEAEYLEAIADALEKDAA